MSYFATHPFRVRITFFPLLGALALAACGSDKSDPTDVGTPPLISIQGVSEGGSYTAPVTIDITTNKGSFDATLDGAAFITGSTVQAPGSHVLIVSARQGSLVSADTVHFTIQGAPGGALIIRMFDLGTKDGTLAPGDAILLTDSSAAGNVNVLIDAGPAGLQANDFSYVSRQLTALHADTVAIMLLTHAHGDHYGGMLDVLNNQKVKRFLYNGQVRSSTGYTNVISRAQQRADSVIVVRDSVRTYNIGYGTTQTMLRFLRPLQTYLNTDTDDGTLLNEGSVGTRLDLGTFSMFFTGDSEVEATRRWRTSYPDLTKNITTLKVGHHGANNAIFDNGLSGTSTWLDFTAPKTSIISANGTSHPRMFALNRLLAQPGNIVYCTNTHGMITITVSRSGSYTVVVEKNAGQTCQKGSDATT